jgi:hypothetical protein
MAEYAIYKSNRVEVLERSGALVKIMPEGGDEWSAYWAKNIDLRPVPQPKASKAVTVPTVVKTSEVEYTDLSWRPSDYTLAVQVRPSNRDFAEQEYLLWAGMSIPEEFVREYEENGYGREWILAFPFDENAAYPFPIVLGGTGGGVALKQSAGILTGNTVRVNYTDIIEPLVRAGLRAR